MTANIETFTKLYAESFAECYPQFDITKTAALIEKALAVACKNIKAVSIDGAAFKLTAKKLGIKNTYSAWSEYLNQ